MIKILITYIRLIIFVAFVWKFYIYHFHCVFLLEFYPLLI